jgi:hypothetical protein
VRSQVDGLPAPFASEFCAAAISEFDGLQFRLIQIFRASADGFLHK